MLLPRSRAEQSSSCGGRGAIESIIVHNEERRDGRRGDGRRNLLVSNNDLMPDEWRVGWMLCCVGAVVVRRSLLVTVISTK